MDTSDNNKLTFEEFYEIAIAKGWLPDLKKMTITEKVLFDYDLHMYEQIKEALGVEKKHTLLDLINSWRRVSAYKSRPKTEKEIEMADLEQHFLHIPDKQMLDQVVKFIQLGEMSDAEKELRLAYSVRHVRRFVPDQFKNNKKRRRKRK
jgi:hypothetical protein